MRAVVGRPRARAPPRLNSPTTPFFPAVLRNWKKSYPGEPAFFIPAGLEQRVSAGKLGRKTGEGYYKWEGDKVLGPV